MGVKQSPVTRDLAGFLVGGLSASISSALVFRAFFPPRPFDPEAPDYTGMVMAMLAFGLFFCGGFVGRRGISADFWSDLVPSVLGTYVTVGFCCIMAHLNLAETAGIIGFASVGVAASIMTTVLLSRWFPQKEQDPQV